MRTKDVTEVLRILEWFPYRDEVGDKCAYLLVNDRIVNIAYDIKRLGKIEKMRWTLSLSTESFSSACENIDPGYGKNAPLINAWGGIDIDASEILETHVQQASKKAILWAAKQDVDNALKQHAALPTNAPGARPIWHLAALAILEDVTKLRAYQVSFEMGDRLGFVPYITKDYIDRALTFAEAHRW